MNHTPYLNTSANISFLDHFCWLHITTFKFYIESSINIILQWCLDLPHASVA
uniref:Uncharacterized protein n=1 Tax=Arundo donax TaxID=35708 RepID=A0A0A9NRD7_ARUDO